MRLKVYWRDGWAYAVGTRPNGVRVRHALKTRDAKRAEEARAHLEARLWKINLYGADAVVTFDEGALRYAESGGDTRFLQKIATHFVGRPLRTITATEIREAAQKLYPKAKPGTWNRQVLTPASAVINYCQGLGWCAPIKIKRFDTPKPEKVAVSDDYIMALQPYLSPRMFALLSFMHWTGRRVGDAIKLEPHQIVGNKVYLGTTKNGEPFTVALPDGVLALLQGLEPRHGRVFGYKARAAVYGPLRRACAKAGVPYLGTHQPGRHSFATMLLSEGWQSSEIAKAGGWKSVSLVANTYEHPERAPERAAKLADARMAQAARRMAKNKGIADA